MAPGHASDPDLHLLHRFRLRRELPQWTVHAVMVFIMVNTGAFHVLAKAALQSGTNQLVFCVYRDCIALLALVPAATCIEGGHRLPISRNLLFAFILLGVTGVLGNQLLFLIGLNLTSPSVAAALQPSIPVFTFLLAILFGIERFDPANRQHLAKLLGLAVCVSGAVTMAVFQGPIIVGHGDAAATEQHLPTSLPPYNHMSSVPGISPRSVLEAISSNSPASTSFPTTIRGSTISSSNNTIGYSRPYGLQHVLGVAALIGNCLAMAAYLTLLAPVLSHYPSPVTVSAAAYASGAAMMMSAAAVTLPWSFEQWALLPSALAAVLYAGLISSALNHALGSWAVHHVGPATVALYTPLQPLSSSVLAHFFLGSPLRMGSVIGGSLVISGLCLVTAAPQLCGWLVGEQGEEGEDEEESGRAVEGESHAYEIGEERQAMLTSSYVAEEGTAVGHHASVRPADK